MPFTASMILFAVMLGVWAWVFGYAALQWPELYRKLPRARGLGLVLGLVCLAWAAYHVCPLLEAGLVKYRVVVKVLVPLIAALSYFKLDYLFARSLGGLLLLSVNHLLFAAFVERVALRPVLATLCYVIAAGGLVLIAYPWRLRDLLQKSATSRRWRRSLACGFAVTAVVFVAFACAA